MYCGCGNVRVFKRDDSDTTAAISPEKSGICRGCGDDVLDDRRTPTEDSVIIGYASTSFFPTFLTSIPSPIRL